MSSSLVVIDTSPITAKFLRDLPNEDKKQKMRNYLFTIKRMVVEAAIIRKTKVVWIVPRSFTHEQLDLHEFIDDLQNMFIDCDVVLKTEMVLNGVIENSLYIDWSK